MTDVCLPAPRIGSLAIPAIEGIARIVGERFLAKTWIVVASAAATPGVIKCVGRTGEEFLGRSRFPGVTVIIFHIFPVKLVVGFGADKTSRKHNATAMIVGLHPRREVDLFQIVQTHGLFGPRFRTGRDRQQQRGQNRHNGDNHQQLYQGEAGSSFDVSAHTRLDNAKSGESLRQSFCPLRSLSCGQGGTEPDVEDVARVVVDAVRRPAVVRKAEPSATPKHSVGA